MATNFDFLIAVDKDLHEIISDAEKLYRDEYFEQSMTQTRRFAECVCKNVLGDRRTSEKTFDEMLATLKDKSTGSEEEKEFLDDLYFIKKQGNLSVHSSTVKQDGIAALECLQRAFETAINYAVFYKNSDKNILNLHYDIELLATGKPDETLAQKYSRAKVKNLSEKSQQKPKKTQSQKTDKRLKPRNIYSKQTTMKKTKNKFKIPIFWIFVSISASISAFLILLLTFMAH